MPDITKGHRISDAITSVHEVFGIGYTTIARMASSAREWTGETERLGPALLGRYLPSLVGPAYSIAGSPGLISQMRAELVHAGVAGRDIGIELYAGY